VIDYLPTALTALAFLLHLLGEHRAVVITGRPRDRRARRRALTFYVALAAILIAVQSPLDGLADQLFWAHMIQHLLLLVVVPPLIVMSRPWMSLWRGMPLGVRRRLARTVGRSRYLGALRWLALPAVAWVLFNANLVFWHLPGPYDLTLESPYLHVLEHTLFFGFGILFWANVTACPPAPRVMSYARRIAYLAAAAVPNVILSMVLAFAQHPLYSHYAQLASRPGGISALADQQLGAGIMWTFGDLPLALAIAVLLHRWLSQQEAASEALKTRVRT
jgi:putative membrane protein